MGHVTPSKRDGFDLQNQNTVVGLLKAMNPIAVAIYLRHLR